MNMFIKENKKFIVLVLVSIAVIFALGFSYISLATDAILSPETKANITDTVEKIKYPLVPGEKPIPFIRHGYYSAKTGEVFEEYQRVSQPAEDPSKIAGTYNTDGYLKSVESSEEAQTYEWNPAGDPVLDHYRNVYCIEHGKGVPKGFTHKLYTAGTPEMIDLRDYFDYDTHATLKSSTPEKGVHRPADEESPVPPNEYGCHYRIVVGDDFDLKTLPGANYTNIVPYAIVYGTKIGHYSYSCIQRCVWFVTDGGSHMVLNEEDVGFDSDADIPTGYEDASTLADDIIECGTAIDQFELRKDAHGVEPEVSLASEGSGGNSFTNIGAYYMESDDVYRVGPFEVSDYAFAYNDKMAGFSGKDLKNQGYKYPNLIGGIEDALIVLTTDSGAEEGIELVGAHETMGADQAKVVFKDQFGTDTYYGVKNYGDESYSNYATGNVLKTLSDAEIQYPLPYGVFYIDIPRELCESNGYTGMKSVLFSYRDIETGGTGTEMSIQYIHSTWDWVNDDTKKCCTYMCMYENSVDCCLGYGWLICPRCDGEGGHEDSDGDWHDCSRCDGEGVVECPHCKGTGYLDHWDSKTSQYCEEHDYYHCINGHFKLTSKSIEEGQHLMAAGDAYVKIWSTIFEYEFNIRLTTQLKIFKYIDEVKHEANDEVIYGEEQDAGSPDKLLITESPDERKELSDAEKEEDPLYVESGDLITFRIDIENYQDYEVQCMIRDTLSESTAEIMKRYDDEDNGWLDYEWITVPGGSEGSPGLKTLYIQIRTNKYDVESAYNLYDVSLDNSKEFYNEVEIVNKNTPIDKSGGDKNNVNFIRTTDEYVSPVININEIADEKNNVDADEKTTISKDYYAINDYKTQIYKYVTEYRPTMTEANNARGITNEENMPDEKKVDRKNQDIYDEENLHVENRYEQGGALVTESYKETYPVAVEKTETLQYAIRVNNIAEKGIDAKPATKVRPTEITDTLDQGLKLCDDPNLNAYMYDENDNLLYKVNDGAFELESIDDTTFKIKLANKDGDTFTTIDPDNYLIYTFDVEVIKTNMYFYKMSNKAEFTVLTNINNIEPTSETVPCPDCAGEGHKYSLVACTLCGGSGSYTATYTNTSITSGCPLCSKYGSIIDETPSCAATKTITHGGDRVIFDSDGSMDINYGEQDSSKDYVRMKDLVISGTVWLDRNKDGLMPENLSAEPVDHEGRQTSNIDYSADGENGEKPMKGIVVKLYLDDGTLLRTTKTDETGLFTFAKDVELNWLTPENYVRTGITNNSCSVTDSVQRVDKGITKDANKNYQDGSTYLKYYIEYEYDGILYKATEIYADDTHINNDGSYVDPYERDSNAYEITSVREELNKKYEYVSFNKAENQFSTNPSFSANLSFDKEGHYSYLNIEPSRLMTARSFLTRQTNADTSQYVNGFYADGTTKYLWLKSFDASVNETPETEYLKFINLGLQEREDADISVMKDIYEITTTVNGEAVTYTYDQLRDEREASRKTTGDSFIENGRIGLDPNAASHEFLNDYIIKKPYGLDLYEADFFYRIEDYEYPEVREYKGEESEMNVEVTYRITIDNTSMRDDYKDSASWKDTQMDLTVNELVDFYDANFKPVTVTGTDTVPTIDMKKANDEDGDFVKDGIYVTDPAGAKTVNTKVEGTHVEDGEGNPYVLLKNQTRDITAAWYYDKAGTKHALTLSNSTSCSAENNLIKNNNPATSGYNLLYITGLSDVKIGEGEQLDIFVKYTLDKEDGLSINGKDPLDRTLKILEEQKNDDKRGNNTIEGIATIATYSLWYTTSGKEAAVVDCDSNTANIGYTETSTYRDYLDDTSIYEDTTYKVDIEMNASKDMTRKMSGMVWDDSRTEELTTNSTADSSAAPITTKYGGPISNIAEDLRLTQYSGNGLFEAARTRNFAAKINEVVTHLYKDESVTEDTDIKVRSAKAEYIEIIAIPDPAVAISGVRYYEEKRPYATAEHVQNIRTNADGEYVLSGYIPGYYIVRFTYGDPEKYTDSYDPSNPYANDNSTILSDMLIFNGQDYKSTKYTGVADTEKDDDNIILELTAPSRNDARDDEIRRLESIAYSERMINFKAEILKGLGNGLSFNRTNAENKVETAYLTPNDSTLNSKEALKTLLDKTNMMADTNRFYARPEKLAKLFTIPGIQSDQIYVKQYEKKNTVDQLYGNLFKITYGDTSVLSERNYDIQNIDFGIEYRPETEVKLEKEIKYVKLQLASDSSDKPTVELFFDYSYGDDEEGKPVKDLWINESKSTGYNVTQVIPNWYTRTNNYSLLSELVDRVSYEGQGWVNIQMDYEILQGAKVEVRYDYIMHNESEVDRISKNLDELRYRENTEASKIYEAFVNSTPASGLEEILQKEYTASGLAALYLKSIYGTVNKAPSPTLSTVTLTPSIPVPKAGLRPESGQNVVNFDLKEGDVVYRTRLRSANIDGSVGEKNSGYYGMFLGNYYYTGEVAPSDKVSQTKFVGVLDYVDTDLRYNATEQEANKYKDNKWTETYAEELRQNGLLKSGSTIFVNLGKDELNEHLVEGIMNPNDILYGDLILTDSDRVKDIDEYNGEEDPTINVDMTRFLYPTDSSRVEVRLEETLPSDIESNRAEVEYENLGEIVEITTQTGRRTNFDTTIGNVYFDRSETTKPPTGEPSSPEFIRATYEPDTAATELISINPNPGMTRRERQVHTAIKNTLNTTMVATLILAVIVIGTISTTVIIKKIKNKPIK